MPDMDLGGWSARVSKEPGGSIRLTDLKNTAVSPRFALESACQLLRVQTRRPTRCSSLARCSVGAIGTTEPDDISDPRFMARHALNMLDPANWPVNIESGHDYVSPAGGGEAYRGASGGARRPDEGFRDDAAIQNAWRTATKSSPELARHAVDYAQRHWTRRTSEDTAFESSTGDIVSAAMISSETAPTRCSNSTRTGLGMCSRSHCQT